MWQHEQGGRGGGKKEKNKTLLESVHVSKGTDGLFRARNRSCQLLLSRRALVINHRRHFRGSLDKHEPARMRAVVVINFMIFEGTRGLRAFHGWETPSGATAFIYRLHGSRRVTLRDGVLTIAMETSVGNKIHRSRCDEREVDTAVDRRSSSYDNRFITNRCFCRKRFRWKVEAWNRYFSIWNFLKFDTFEGW